MSTEQPDAATFPGDIVDETVSTVRRWLAESANVDPDASSVRLAGLLKDPRGLDFTLGFVDRVVRPEDLRVAARNLERLSRSTPKFLPWYQRAAVSAGGTFAPLFPWLVVPTARKVLRRMVGHLIVDATPAHLDASLEALRGEGRRLNINLLGEAVLGEAEADARLAGNRALLERADVDYLSIKVSAIASGLSMWGFEETVTRVVERLTPLYELAASSTGPKFINLDMEEFRDLELTVEVFERLLEQPSLQSLEAGIVLQAYLPEALPTLQRLTAWAIERRARGGAPIKVRVVKGANLAMERVDAAIHGWPLAPFASKRETDTNYKRVLDWALRPEHTAAVRIGVASHNLFDVAFAWLLAQHRQVEGDIDFEMLVGMATTQAEAVSRDVGGLILYTPVVQPKEFDAAIGYLVRRLEENASPENFMSGLFELANSKVFKREEQRFRAAFDALLADPDTVPAPNRVQDRTHPLLPDLGMAADDPTEALVDVDLDFDAAADADAAETVLLDTDPMDAVLVDEVVEDSEPTEKAPEPEVAAESAVAAPAEVADSPDEQVDDADNDVRRFSNVADTDTALAANRAWGRRVIERSVHSTIGRATIAVSHVTSEDRLNSLIDVTARAGDGWAAVAPAVRARQLRDIGDVLAAFRGRLIEVMAVETGKSIAEADVEVGEAVDFAHYYADRLLELDDVTGARFVPPRLTLVTPPWNFPVAIPAGSVLAALAVGSGVILKPAPQARRCAAVLVEAFLEAGLPQDLLTLIDISEDELGQKLVASPQVDRVVLTGAWETAELFRSWRPNLPMLAETSGKNAIIVTPSADLDLAVSDIVRSAFGHAGQKCSAASLVILVGPVALSNRFRRQLVDAVSSLRVGYPQDLDAQMGPLIEPASGKLLTALTTLEKGERWYVAPRRLDDTGRLWSPGVRAGIAPGSAFHRTEYFGPVLGVMTANTLEEAIALQNDTGFGLTAGIHSLDATEVRTWLDTVEAGNLYVNRGITGAIVGRQPFGGWKRSSVGAGAKAGGPNYLHTLGTWAPVEVDPADDLKLTGLHRRVAKVIKRSQEGMEYAEFDRVRRAALNDEQAWTDVFGTATDLSELGVERNVLRYRPVPVTLRLDEGGSLADLLRLVAAAARTRSPLTISSAVPLPSQLVALFADPGSPVEVDAVVVESDHKWLARVREGELATPRVRVVGGDGSTLADALGGSPEVAIYAGPVTTAGRIELLTFLREQSVSITAHRFGTVDHEMVGLRL